MKAYDYKFDRTKKLRVNELGAFDTDTALDFTLRLILPHGMEVHSAAMGIHRDAWNTGHTEFLTFPMRPVPGEGCVSDWLLELDPRRDLPSEEGAEGLYYYHYAVQLADGSCFVFGGERPTELDALSNYVGERQLLLYRPDFHASSRFREGLVYHIFVDRFAKSGKAKAKPGTVLDPDWDNGTPQFGEYPGSQVPNNVFFGGDLPGITGKISFVFLVQSLPISLRLPTPLPSSPASRASSTTSRPSACGRSISPPCSRRRPTTNTTRATT